MHPAQTQTRPLAAEPTHLVAAMDAATIGTAVVSPAAVFPDNGYILGAAARWPGRLLPVVSLDPRDASALSSLEAHAANGAVAVRIHPGQRPLQGDEEESQLVAFVQTSAALGIAVQWTIRLPWAHLLPLVASRAAGLVQVLDHLGLPPDVSDLAALSTVRDVASVPDTFVKLSGMYALSAQSYPFQDTWDWAEGVVEAFGAERTMWASDWPLSTGAATLEQWRDLPARLPFLDATSREQILSRTAPGVWRRHG